MVLLHFLFIYTNLYLHPTTLSTTHSSLRILRPLSAQAALLPPLATMVSSKKRIEWFIDDIPDCKLEGGMSGGTIHSDENLRLDLQNACPSIADTQFRPCLISVGLAQQSEDIQSTVQVNNQCPIPSMRLMNLWTVAKCLAPVDNPWTAQQIKDALKASNQGRPLK